MKKLLLSIGLPLSLISHTSGAFGNAIKANDQVLPATDPHVLRLFTLSKEEIAIKHIELLQKNLDQQTRIRELENTIEERSYRAGMNRGWAIGGCVSVLAIIISLATRGAGHNGSRF